MHERSGREKLGSNIENTGVIIGIYSALTLVPANLVVAFLKGGFPYGIDAMETTTLTLGLISCGGFGVAALGKFIQNTNPNRVNADTSYTSKSHGRLNNTF